MADEPTVVDVDVSDEDLFNEAKADAAPEPAVAVAAETETPPPEPGDQPRDQHGRFASPKAGDTPPPVGATPPAAEPPPEPDGGHIPAWRLREEAENRRAAEAKYQQLERQLEELRRNPPKPPEPPKPQVKPDPLLDPEGYEAYLESKIEARFAAAEQARIERRGEARMQAARKANPERFDKALAAIHQSSPADRLRVREANDPGDELLAWYDEQETKLKIREAGSLAAYEQRALDNALKDPAFLAKAQVAARALAMAPNGNGTRSPSLVRLPPSLHGITPSGAAPAGDDDTDMSDEAIFRHATAGPRR